MTTIEFNLEWKLKLQNRFINYVKIFSTSDPESETTPSTERQWNIANYIYEELKTLGLSDVSLDENGYIYAYVPSNLENDDEPVVGFISHYDTSPDFNGENVKPQIWDDYDGKDLLLNKETGFILSPSKFESLKDYVGRTLITTDGTTLLGADDKAGVAEIVTAAEFLLAHPEIKHGKIAIGFTPDEEIGRGAHKFDVAKFGAEWAYTMDGGEVGELEYENFNAAGAVVKIHGLSVHPGYAFGKMVNASLLAAEFIKMLPALPLNCFSLCIVRSNPTKIFLSPKASEISSSIALSLYGASIITAGLSRCRNLSSSFLLISFFGERNPRK